MLKIPDSMTTQAAALCDLVEANPVTIKIADAARMVGMNPATYRAAAVRGQIPFAIGAKKNGRRQRVHKNSDIAVFPVHDEP